MSKISYELKPRDVLFFRDARPMDVDKAGQENIANVGHGANWPRPDLLFSAVIHDLIRDSEVSDEEMYCRFRKNYGSVNDLRVTGPFPCKEGELYLPTPLDWDMRLGKFTDKGVTDIPAPLTAGFFDRCIGKKSHPQWISTADYARYLKGEVGMGKRENEPDEPKAPETPLFHREPRVCTSLDAETGASRRIEDRHASGQYEAEYLRLAKGVTMRCDVESRDAEKLAGADVRFGGQGGLVRFEKIADGVAEVLAKLPTGEKSRFVRWTLLAPALFINGWYPNWLSEDGHVMIPAVDVAREPGETRAAFRARRQKEMKPFASAHLIAARIGDAVPFSGYDTQNAEKPTELAVPAGSCYVFECDTPEEAQQLIGQLSLKARSDLGEKGFGYGICSYVAEPQDFTPIVGEDK